MAWSVPKMWDGGTCYIIAGGPSMPRQFGVPEEIIAQVMAQKLPPSTYSDYMTPIHDKHVIGVNNAFLIGNWIDVEFFGDSGYAQNHKAALHAWSGIRVSCAREFTNATTRALYGVKYLDKARKLKGISTNPSTISFNCNSGGGAINLAYHLGVKKIYLLGYDMKLDSKGVSHWHGSHNARAKRSKAPPFSRHLSSYPTIAKDAQKLGLEIINLNQDSAITVFPKQRAEWLL